MDLSKLTLVGGQPREAIEKKLKDAGIDYALSGNDKDAPYFRACIIDLVSKRMTRGEPVQYVQENKQNIRDGIVAALGFPDHFQNDTYSYYAQYRMNPGFDMTELNKKITFSNGLLVELTKIWI